MLIAIITYLFITFGVGSDGFLPKNFAKQVKKQITDEVRKSQVLDINKQIGKEVKASNRHFKKLSKEMLALTENHAASADEFQTIVDALFIERRRNQKELINTRLKLKDKITREEWEAIFSANK